MWIQVQDESCLSFSIRNVLCSPDCAVFASTRLIVSVISIDVLLNYLHVLRLMSEGKMNSWLCSARTLWITVWLYAIMSFWLRHFVPSESELPSALNIWRVQLTYDERHICYTTTLTLITSKPLPKEDISTSISWDICAPVALRWVMSVCLSALRLYQVWMTLQGLMCTS